MAVRSAAIVSVGMMTAVGLNTPQTAAAVRARIARFRETACFDKHLEPIVAAALPEEALPDVVSELESLPGLPPAERRMLRLATGPLREVLAPVSMTGPLPLLLGLPEATGVTSGTFTEAFLEHLVRQAGVALDLTRSQVFSRGRASGLLALKAALDRLGHRGVRYVVVGGVDTYMDQELLGRLDREGRINSEDNLDGFIPGEGAGFLVIAGPTIPGDLGLEPIAWIDGVGTGFEKGHLYSHEAYRGEGLADAFRGLFGSLPPKNNLIRSVHCTLNGEHYWAKEWGVAYLRHREWFEEDHAMLHPADCFGDTGAAMAPLLIGLAAEGLRRGYRQGPCLVWCSSDHGDRGAVLLQDAKQGKDS